MQAAAAMAGSDLDTELMELVERSTELVGARGSAAYTLRFEHGDVDLLLRVAVDGEQSRIDGWVVPAEPMTIRALSEAGVNGHEAVVSESGPVRDHRPAARPDAAAPRAPRHRTTCLRHPDLRDLTAPSQRTLMSQPRDENDPPQAQGARPRPGTAAAGLHREHQRPGARPRDRDRDQGGAAPPDRLRRPAADHLQVGGRRRRPRRAAQGRRAAGLDGRARRGGPHGPPS